MIEDALRDMVADISARQAVEPLSALADIRASYCSGYHARGADYVDNVAVDQVEPPRSAVPLRLYTPAQARADTLILYFHGGGYVLGDVETYDRQSRWIADQTGHRVASVDYRLGPEHRFPAAPDDAMAAWDWATGTLQVLPENIIISGDSAGGGLAVVSSLHAAKQGATPRAAVLLYPWTELRLPDRERWEGSMKAFAQGHYLETEELYWFSDNYLRSDDDRLDWRSSIILAPDLHLMPPTWIFAAQADPLYDQGIEFAATLRAKGIAVTHQGFDGILHNFMEHLQISPGSRHAAQLYLATLCGIFDGRGA